MRVRILSPDLEEPLAVDVEVGRALLLGRAPDVTRLPPAASAGLRADGIRPVEVAARRVSANHALVACDASGAVSVRDLGSRNGTWLELPASAPVTLPGPGAATLTLELAGADVDSDEEDRPREAAWAEPGEFGGALRVAVEAYLRRRGLPTAVRWGARRPPEPSVIALPLDDGSDLELRLPPEVTADARLPAALGRVRAYVADENARFRGLQQHEEGLLLVSPSIRKTHRQVEEAAAKGMRVVLLGPTGVGKDRLARCYHEHSRQARGPFHAINCGQLSKGLIYAQLFGARKGSFTGSTRDLPGAVESAADGTLFLDEVGDMPRDVQIALLRFLDRRGEYHRLGEEDRPRTARNVQIVGATNADIRQKIASGDFREDLWYRIAEKTIQIAPLRERREDIAAYLKTSTPGERREDHLERLRGRGAHVGVSTHDALTPEALELVLAEPWPGNFRVLESFVLRLPSTTKARSLGVAECRAALGDGGGVIGGGAATAGSPSAEMDDDRWGRAVAEACRAFTTDRSASPATWGQLGQFVERYLKPVFVAYASGREAADEIGRDVNFSDLARQLDVKDGTTVKTHLRRYVERFRLGRVEE